MFVIIKWRCCNVKSNCLKFNLELSYLDFIWKKVIYPYIVVFAEYYFQNGKDPLEYSNMLYWDSNSISWDSNLLFWCTSIHCPMQKLLYFGSDKNSKRDRVRIRVSVTRIRVSVTRIRVSVTRIRVSVDRLGLGPGFGFTLP